MRLRNLRPGYVIRRLGQIWFQRSYPGSPWLTEGAVRLLDSWLRPTDWGIEWGSGRSTIWLARRVAGVLSIEHDARWHEMVRGMLADAGVAGRVDYRLVPCDLGELGDPPDHPYVLAAEAVTDGSADFVLVDGMIRLPCARLALRKLRPGGLLILDNANRFVPNPSLGRPATIHEPRSEPREPGWVDVLAELARWRAILTTDGIWDTRFWVKPHSGE
jgi:SAM-dependent methyltransferase